MSEITMLYLRQLRVAVKALNKIKCNHTEFSDYDVCDGCYARDALITIAAIGKAERAKEEKRLQLREHYKNFE
jgi:hypothetical protein